MGDVDEGAALVVVWADPGVTTGWGVVRVPISSLLDRGQVAVIPEMWWRCGQFRSADTSEGVDSYLHLCRAVWEKTEEEDLVVIGSESFTLMMQSTDPALLEPVRFLAVLRDRLRGTGVGVETQGASEMKRTITEDRLRLWGLWKPGAVHARDALRHCLLFLRRFVMSEEIQRRVGWKPE